MLFRFVRPRGSRRVAAPAGRWLTWRGRFLLERAMGIEPTQPAWKAGALPLSYARPHRVRQQKKRKWWAEEDLNLRRLSQQIYSLSPLTTRESAHASNRSRGKAIRPTDPAKGWTDGLHIQKIVIIPAAQGRHAWPLLELAVGIEPTTAGLQNRCSTVELRQQRLETPNVTPKRRTFQPLSAIGMPAAAHQSMPGPKNKRGRLHAGPPSPESCDRAAGRLTSAPRPSRNPAGPASGACGAPSPVADAAASALWPSASS